MSDSPQKNSLHPDTYKTAIWEEEASKNPYYPKACYCFGYDVFNDVLKNGTYNEYLYLLLTGNQIDPLHIKLFETLLIALAHPGLRDPSVRAAMNAGVGGSRAAAALMAAVAVGAGQAGGAHELKLALDMHMSARENAETWQSAMRDSLLPQEADVWLQLEHIPGFDPYLATIIPPSYTLLQHCAELAGPNSHTQWFLMHYMSLEKAAGYGVNFIGVIASVLMDLKIDSAIAEYFFMFARLPGAAIHAQEAKMNGFRQFPFFNDSIHLTNDPGPKNKCED